MPLFIVLIMFFASLTVRADLIWGLRYSGSNGAYVSDGKTEVVLAGQDNFTMTGNIEGENIELDLNNFQIEPMPANLRLILLTFGSGNYNTPPEVGRYTNATRSYNYVGIPVLSFSMDGRGNNTLTGEFQILEFERSPTGSLQKFAADFVQRGDNGIAEFGSVRFGSEIPFTVPEPESASLLIMSLLLRSIWMRRKV